MPRNRLFCRPALYWGLALLMLHTLLVLRTVWFCYQHRHEGQVELAWLLFEVVDFPAVPCFRWLMETPPLAALWDWGYRLMDSGPNLSQSVYVALVGGLQWFSIGCFLGASASGLSAHFSSGRKL